MDELFGDKKYLSASTLELIASRVEYKVQDMRTKNRAEYAAPSEAFELAMSYFKDTQSADASPRRGAAQFLGACYLILSE